MNTKLSRLLSIAAGAALTLSAGLAGAQTEPARRSVELSDARGGEAVLNVTGEVTAVDAQRRIVSIKGPRGNINDLLVDPAVRNLDQVKVGDRVRLSYRVGVATWRLRSSAKTLATMVVRRAMAAPGRAPFSATAAASVSTRWRMPSPPVISASATPTR